MKELNALRANRVLSKPHQTPKISAGIYLLKVNNRNTRRRCEICSILTIKTPEQHHWSRSEVFIVNFEHTSHFVLVFLLLTLYMYLPAKMELVFRKESMSESR